ncbi:MAG: dihydroorotate dehydrogenase [Chitinophagaceae bacterium]
MANLQVNIGNIIFKNPLIAASGTFGFGREYNELYDISLLGGISTKGITMEPRLGNETPRIAESEGVVLNAVGLQNPGVEKVIEKELPFLRTKNIVVIANVAGNTIEDYQHICKRLDGLVDFIELNISCPNVKCGGMAFGIKPQNVFEVTKASKMVLQKTPLMVKLSPNVEDIALNSKAVEDGGADVVSLVNTFTGMLIDIHKRKPILANNTGGVSGAGIKPIAIRMVYQVAQTIKIPIIGMGGIYTAEDAIQFILAGASAVQVGTANFTNPYAIPHILQEINLFLDTHNIQHLSDLVGKVKIN